VDGTATDHRALGAADTPSLVSCAAPPLCGIRALDKPGRGDSLTRPVIRRVETDRRSSGRGGA